MDRHCYYYKMSLLVFNKNYFVLTPNICIAISALLWLLFAWYIFFHAFTLNLFVSLDLKYVSHKQHIVDEVFFFF